VSANFQVGFVDARAISLFLPDRRRQSLMNEGDKIGRPKAIKKGVDPELDGRMRNDAGAIDVASILPRRTTIAICAVIGRHLPAHPEHARLFFYGGTRIVAGSRLCRWRANGAK